MQLCLTLPRSYFLASVVLWCSLILELLHRIAAVSSCWWLIVCVIILPHHEFVWDHLRVAHHSTFRMLLFRSLTDLATGCLVLSSPCLKLRKRACNLLLEFYRLRRWSMDFASQDRDSAVIIQGN
jgi:hypothetical protein